MSTASASKKVSKKEVKEPKVTKEEHISDMEHSDSENDKHSIYNGDFKKNPIEAKHFLKHFNAIAIEFYDDDSKEKVLKHIWGESYEALTDLIKKSNKKEKSKKAKFAPSDIEKPKKPIDIFGKLFSEESKEKGVKFTKDNNYLVCRKQAWDALSTKEQEKYEKLAKKQQEAYDIEFAKQKAEAIKNGEFPEDKIKGPCTAYFLFLADIRPKLTEKFKDDADKNTKITKEGGKLWKALSEKEKEKYSAKYREAKAEYDIKKQEWKTNEIERVKKQENLPAEVKVESSGSKKVEKKTEKKSEKTDKKANKVTSESDNNTDSEEAEVKSAKSKKEKKTSKKVEVVEEEDDEVVEADEANEADEEEEVIVEKTKTKAKASAKATKAK
jgi:hypothetical protein